MTQTKITTDATADLAGALDALRATGDLTSLDWDGDTAVVSVPECGLQSDAVKRLVAETAVEARLKTASSRGRVYHVSAR